MPDDGRIYTAALTSLRTAYDHLIAVRAGDATPMVDADEVRAKNRLIALCKRIAEDYKDIPV